MAEANSVASASVQGLRACQSEARMRQEAGHASVCQAFHGWRSDRHQAEQTRKALRQLQPDMAAERPSDDGPHGQRRLPPATRQHSPHSPRSCTSAGDRAHSSTRHDRGRSIAISRRLPAKALSWARNASLLSEFAVDENNSLALILRIEEGELSRARSSSHVRPRCSLQTFTPRLENAALNVRE